MQFARSVAGRISLFATFAVAAALVVRNDGAADEKPGAGSRSSSEGKMLRHVVLFKFKPSTTPEQLKEVTDAFAALPAKIDVIKDFEWGTDVSVENLSKGFTHCFFVTFAVAAGRDAYLPHPAHKEFVDLVKPKLDDVTVVDYWVK